MLPQHIESAILGILDGPRTERDTSLAELMRSYPAHADAIRSRADSLRDERRAGQAVDRVVDHHHETDTPSRIGPYRIVGTLGEGGMGTVYRAEQREPVKRPVALKLIKLGMDSRAVVHRFEQERQALALMDHEGIARVFDCGTTERGQPYFVMELVRGVPLDSFCEQARLSLEERILLMRQVCAAVQHAHQKGVVHRDLKPGNVLVSEAEGRRQVKIIDFGLAKAMGQKLVEATLFTEAGQVVGTPEYMAPEQADPTNQDIDTRADIYSLGVMLYQVLVGELPFSAQDLRRAGMLEVQRILREVDPPKPSSRITSSSAVVTRQADTMRVSVGALRRAMVNDLDWVILKALEKDRGRRYDTANALAADLQRFLDHEPLVAGPPSAAYRLRKLVRRYRGQVMAGTAVLITAVGGAVVALNFALSASALAEEKSTLADSNAGLARENGRVVEEFEQLKGVVRYQAAVSGVEELLQRAPWPAAISAMQDWLDNCASLLEMRHEIRGTIASTRTLAMPWTADEQRRDLETHPDFKRLQDDKAMLASLEYAQSVRSGARALSLPEMSEEQEQLDLNELNSRAWVRVAPEAAQDGRSIWGEEPLGLAYAKLAHRKAGDHPAVLDTLAWALLANGQDEEARRHSAAALAAIDEGQRAEYQTYHDKLVDASNRAPTILTELRSRVTEEDARVRARRTYTFAVDLQAQAFLHDTLVDLLEKLAQLETEQRPLVEQRLWWAKHVEDLTREHPGAACSWAEVRERISVSKRYAGRDIDFADADVTGLVPMGRNPVTGFEEFYHLRSAWDGTGDPKEIVVPRHAEDGAVTVGQATGVVFVLLPGGTFTMGASPTPGQSNFDAAARMDETPHRVTLDPFFIARHEVTRAQWMRLFGTAQFFWRGGQMYQGGQVIGDSHPAEYVHWEEARSCLVRYGLALPTEAQWEYACRAGTDTVFWPGNDEVDLLGCANVLDLTCARFEPQWGTPTRIEDGYVGIAPVDAFEANAFGLFCTHGNLYEWCEDRYGPYTASVRAGDGLHQQDESFRARISRGGCFNSPATPRARSAHRSHSPPRVRDYAIGLRAARRLRP